MNKGKVEQELEGHKDTVLPLIFLLYSYIIPMWSFSSICSADRKKRNSSEKIFEGRREHVDSFCYGVKVSIELAQIEYCYLHPLNQIKRLEALSCVNVTLQTGDCSLSKIERGSEGKQLAWISVMVKENVLPATPKHTNQQVISVRKPNVCLLLASPAYFQSLC